ncbi:hypothetical protein ACEPAI_2449 [Sanghuangporus weigelae]
MITKGEHMSRNPFEQDLARDVSDSSLHNGESNRSSSIGESPPTYDDPNYIPSPSSVSRSNTVMLPLVAPQATGFSASATWSHPGSSSTVTTVSTPMYLMSPEVETEWNRTLHDLERNMSSLQAARTRAAQPKQADAKETVREVRALEELVLGNMRQLALIHPDPRVQAEWHTRAEAFMRTMSTFQPPEPQSSAHIEIDDDAESYTESYSDPGRARNDDFIIDRQPRRHGEGSSSFATPSFSSKAKRMLAKADEDKGLSYIKKGTAGIFLAPIVISGALAYGTAALFYGAGKGAFHLGKKAANAASNASSSRMGMPLDSTLRSASNPELLASPTKSTFKDKSGMRRHL